MCRKHSDAVPGATHDGTWYCMSYYSKNTIIYAVWAVYIIMYYTQNNNPHMYTTHIFCRRKSCATVIFSSYWFQRHNFYLLPNFFQILPTSVSLQQSLWQRAHTREVTWRSTRADRGHTSSTLHTNNTTSSTSSHTPPAFPQQPTWRHNTVNKAPWLSNTRLLLLKRSFQGTSNE